MTAPWFRDFIAENNEIVLGYKFGVREDRQYRTAVNEEMNSPKSIVVGSASGSAHSEATQSRHYGKLHSDPTKYLTTAELVDHLEVSERWHLVLGVDKLPLPIPRRRVFAQPQLTPEGVKDLLSEALDTKLAEALDTKLAETLDTKLPDMLSAALSCAAPILADAIAEAVGAILASKPGVNPLEVMPSSQATDGSSTSTRNASNGIVPSDAYTEDSSAGSFIDDRTIDSSLPHHPNTRSAKSNGKKRAIAISDDDSFEDAPAAKRSKEFKALISRGPEMVPNDDDVDFSRDSDASPIAPRRRHSRRLVISSTSPELLASPSPIPLPAPSLPRRPKPQASLSQNSVIIISDSNDEADQEQGIRCKIEGKDYELTSQNAQGLMFLALKSAFNDADAAPRSVQQSEALRVVMMGQEDACANIPTSGGKSLLWQLVPFVFPENISVVVVTHVALRAQHTKDAVKMGIRAAAFDPQHLPELEVQIVFVMLEHCEGRAFKESVSSPTFSSAHTDSKCLHFQVVLSQAV